MEVFGINNMEKSGSALPEKYDINKDGVVDINDYNLAKLNLLDEDTTNDPDISVEELDEAFSTILEEWKGKDEEITEDNAVKSAEELAQSAITTMNPENAKTLNELQEIGVRLVSTVKRCNTLTQILDKKIALEQQKLEEIEKEKEVKEREYVNVAQDVTNKQEELSSLFDKIDSVSSSLKSQKEVTSSAIISDCVDRYKKGEFGDKSLEEVIMSEMALKCNISPSELTSALSDAGELGDEISHLCDDISVLVKDIRTINSNYNSQYNDVTSLTTLRKQTWNTGKTASDNYQKGYEKRTALRNELIQKYTAEAIEDENLIVSGKNPQIQKLGEFLDNKELDKMPYDDAMIVMKAVFTNCGIEFDDKTKEVTLPWGADGAASNILTALDDALYRNYKIKTTRPKYDEEDNQKVYIISGYNNTQYANIYGNNKLTIGENIKDFAGQNAYSWARSGIFSGSGVHDHNQANNEEWMELYSKLSDEVKNMTIEKGEAYIVKADGTLVGTVATDQLGNMGYWESYRSDKSVYNDNFSVLGNLNVDGGYGASEEGSGGTICFDGKAYDVAQTIVRKETPLILDLKGDGLELTNMSKGVNFDLNGDGTMDRTAWTSAHTDFDDAFLVYDKNGDGAINDGKELFGSQNGAINGFAELGKYDSNNDGKIDNNDNIFDKLQLWSDMNGDGKVDDGELKTLKEMGVAEISTKYNEVHNAAGDLLEDKNGNTIGLQGSFKKDDGSVSKMTDVLFKTTDLEDYNKIHNIDSKTGEIIRKEETNFFDKETFALEAEDKVFKANIRKADRHEVEINFDNSGDLKKASKRVNGTIETLNKQENVSSSESVKPKKKEPPKPVEDQEK